MARLKPWFRAALTEFLLPRHFVHRGTGVFEYRATETCLYLEFVPAKYRTPDDIEDVAGHIGITSFTISNVFPRPIPPATLNERQVHWFRGAGYINDDLTGPHTWLVDAKGDAPIERVFDALDDLLIPALMSRDHDRGLYEDWTSRRDWSISTAAQSGYVAVLAAKFGEWSAYRESIEAIERECLDGEADLYRRECVDILDAVRGLRSTASTAATTRRATERGSPRRPPPGP